MINVIEAFNLAPYAAANDRDFGSSSARLKIADFRALVDSLNWSRNDLTGGTREEFKRQDIPGRLGRHIARIEGALPLVPARYAADIESARSAIAYARQVIERWHAAPAVSR
jgi:hypothetical protein